MRTWLLLTSVLLLTPLMVFAQDNTSTAFVPLTSIPGIESAGNAQSLPDFLNNLYRLAIGAAAVLAVLQIVRAGIMYMGGDSVTEKKEAKSLIALSVGGLILILSPVVVFSIINPDILSLKINKLGELADTTFEAYQRGQEIGGRTETLLWTNSVLSRSAAEAKCKTDGGTHLEYVCKKPDGTTRTLAVSQSCVAGEEGLGFCYKTGVSGGGSDSEMQKMCELYHRTIAPEGGSCAKLVDDGWSKMDNACCGGLTAGNQCCGKLKTSPNEPPPTTGPNVNNQLATRFYVYRPVTGSPAPRGPVPASKSTYDAYAAACTTKPGTVTPKYGSAEDCTAAEMASYSGSDKAYIRCMPVTVSCIPK